MTDPCPNTIRAVRRAQLALVRQHIRKLEDVVDDLPTLADTLDPDRAPDDEQLADDYVELRERLELLIQSVRHLHFRACGRYAYELRTFCED